MSAIREILAQIGNLFVWFVLVAPWEQGLRVRLGKHIRLLNPGCHLRIPYFDRIYRQSIRRRLCSLFPQTLTTKDGHAVTVAGTLGYKIVDLQTLYDTLHDAQGTLEAHAMGLVSEFIIKSTLAECTAGQLQEYVKKRLDLTKFGLNGVEFFVTSFAVVRTYRFLTGDTGRSWSDGHLDTSEAVSIGKRID